MSPLDPWGGDIRDILLTTALLPGIAAERAVAARMADPEGDPRRGPTDALAPVWARAAADPELVSRVASERASLSRHGAWWLTPADPSWPSRAPAGVLRGIGRLAEPAVAIVGARRADPYGLDVAARIARAAVHAGYAVVSGGAFGVDVAAHRAALDAGGKTIAVLGSGLDHPSPASHRGLFAEVAERGAVVSPFPCAQKAARWTFPRRNPYVAGLATVVIVVQAGARSGSLQTARAAIEQGTPVFAVPGPMDAPLHRGCHALIDAGARVLTAPDAWVTVAEPVPGAESPPTGPDVSSPTVGRALWRVAGVEPRPLSALAVDAGLDFAEAARDATMLELEGWLKAAPGGRFVRTRPGR